MTRIRNNNEDIKEEEAKKRVDMKDTLLHEQRFCGWLTRRRRKKNISDCVLSTMMRKDY